MKSIRPGLMWFLLASLGLSALALWLPDDKLVPLPVGAAIPAGTDRNAAGTLEQSISTTAETLALPSKLEPNHLEPAQFDPFVGVVQPPPAPPRTTAPPVLLPAALAPALQVSPPAPNYRYLGQMTDPDGQKRVYLVKSDVPVSATVGTQLEDGYVVENISEEGIILYQAAQDTRAVIAVPLTPPETVTQ